MLRSLMDLQNYHVGATDGPIGQVKDFYFDDDAWVVRYFVVETGNWLSSRQVLVSPISVRHADWVSRTLSAAITREQVRHSPSIDTDKPVSRQNEEQYIGYYGYPGYWGSSGLWGADLYPDALNPGLSGLDSIPRTDRVERDRQLEVYLADERSRHRNDDPHLRSCKVVADYDVLATDGDVGRVKDFLVDDETWLLRHLVIETGHWWAGHQVLVSPRWIRAVNWADRTVKVDLDRASLQAAPAYDAKATFSREQEQSLYRHHGRSGWGGSTVLPVVPA